MRKNLLLSAAILMCAPKLQSNMLFFSKIFRSFVQNQNQGDPVAPSSPRERKMEQFYQKKGFTKKQISKIAHLRFSSNFAKIYFTIWTTTFIFKPS
jgi:hypothetical protein